MSEKIERKEEELPGVIVVDGIGITGFTSKEEAQKHIDNDKKLKAKGAIASNIWPKFN